MDTANKHMNRGKMISIILLLINLTSCFCAHVTPTSYQTEENHDITLEWMFTILTNRPIDSYEIYCEMFTDLRPSVLFHLHEGVEVSEFQDEQFAGRVQCDKDVLREGRVRLHMSRLRTDDSGKYVCQVIIHYDVFFSECQLSVTAARPNPEGSNATSKGWIALYWVLGLTAAAAALLGVCYCLFVHFQCRRRGCSPRVFNRIQSSAPGSVETIQSTI